MTTDTTHQRSTRARSKGSFLEWGATRNGRFARIALFAVAAIVFALGARASDPAAPVGVVAEIQDPDAGKALWRAEGENSWHDVTILQNLQQGNQLAVEGGTRLRAFLFRDKRLVDLTTQTASVAAPYVVDEKKAKDKNTQKLIEGLEFVSNNLPGPMRGEDLQMTDLLTRSPEPYCVLVSPRNTRIDNATPVFEWIESYGQGTSLTLSLDEKTLWQRSARADDSPLAYPAGQPPLEPGLTYTIRLESPGAQPDVTHCIYRPLSEREIKAEREWEESLPPKTEVAGAVLRATRAVAHRRFDAARAILTEGLALHPGDRTLRGLLIAVYLEQGNGCFADREIAEYEKRKAP